MEGLIIKAIGGIYTVEASDGVYECSARGVFRKKGISPVCGDRVEFTPDDGGVVTAVKERRSLLVRPPLANLDVLVFVASTCEPQPSLLLLDKFIAVAEHKGMIPAIVFTKIDKSSAEEYLNIYRLAEIPAFAVNNDTGEGSREVREFISGKLSAFTGNTGVGKSSLMNNIFPGLELSTGEVSRKLGRGRHTTRHVQLFKLEEGGYVADTPGFSSFETNRYDIIFKDRLAACFREFAHYTDDCLFPDCSHTKEKGCGVINAVNEGRIAASRHSSYTQMYEEARQLKEWEHKK